MPAGRPLRDRSLLMEHCEDTIASCDELRDLARSLNGETSAQLHLVQGALVEGRADQLTLLQLETIELRELRDEDGVSRVVNALLRATHETLLRGGCLHLWPAFETAAHQHLHTALRARQVAGQRFGS